MVAALPCWRRRRASDRQRSDIACHNAVLLAKASRVEPEMHGCRQDDHSSSDPVGGVACHACATSCGHVRVARHCRPVRRLASSHRRDDADLDAAAASATDKDVLLERKIDESWWLLLDMR
jgi:hypothetical protein